MSAVMTTVKNKEISTQKSEKTLKEKVNQFAKGNYKKAFTQLANTIIPFVLLLMGMYYSIQLNYPYWVTVAIGLVASFFNVRMFIFFHDCAHNSFMPTTRGNKILGWILGIFVFAAYTEWRYLHGIHHSNAGNLDKRGIGDIPTMTFKEYKEANWLNKFAYRLLRTPLLFFVGAPLVFLIGFRFPTVKPNRKRLISLLFTDIALILGMVAMSWWIGLDTYIKIHAPILVFASTTGAWMIYVQHQFDPSYWERNENWDWDHAALEGSSYYKLPRLFQWLTGNIGLHHIHHLNPRVPNYNLQACLEAIPELQMENHITARKSLDCMKLNIWNEKTKTFLTFKDAHLKIKAEA